ncbi:MAG: hypothetical protein AAGN66_01180 [Acidobacteriota bacterium]
MTRYALVLLLLIVPMTVGAQPTEDGPEAVEPSDLLEWIEPQAELIQPEVDLDALFGFPMVEILSEAGGFQPEQRLLDCSSFNSSWCTYRFDRQNFCCVPVNPSPGVYCPRICI